MSSPLSSGSKGVWKILLSWNCIKMLITAMREITLVEMNHCQSEVAPQVNMKPLQ